MTEFVPLITGEDFNQQSRLNNLKEKFKNLYGELPEFICRAPGRVNIIGEHIDYCGYAVLPMAIDQDVLIAGSKNGQSGIKLSNVNEKYLPHETTCSSFEIDKVVPKWYHYFLCGYKGILERCGGDQGVGLNILMDGTVPSCAGLSSSSAVVCSSALATTLALGLKLSQLELAETCQQCERYIGTEGGGMDQSISFLALKGKAKLVEFNPIRGTDVQIPKGGTFVIANSCVEMNKAATDHFNIRVAECRLAAQLLANKKGENWRELKRLGDVQKKLNLSLAECIDLVKNLLHSEPYSKQEICKELGVTEEELNELSLGPRSKHVQEFKLQDRALHVYSEALRVLDFKRICDTASGDLGDVTLKQLGNLMKESHESCRDLYQCSCNELDEIVDYTLQIGALGSRLTGAGWGGCSVSLIREEETEDFLQKMREFYMKKGFPDAVITASLFATRPGAGASVIVV